MSFVSLGGQFRSTLCSKRDAHQQGSLLETFVDRTWCEVAWSCCWSSVGVKRGRWRCPGDAASWRLVAQNQHIHIVATLRQVSSVVRWFLDRSTRCFTCPSQGYVKWRKTSKKVNICRHRLKMFFPVDIYQENIASLEGLVSCLRRVQLLEWIRSGRAWASWSLFFPPCWLPSTGVWFGFTYTRAWQCEMI